MQINKRIWVLNMSMNGESIVSYSTDSIYISWHCAYRYDYRHMQHPLSHRPQELAAVRSVFCSLVTSKQMKLNTKSEAATEPTLDNISMGYQTCQLDFSGINSVHGDSPWNIANFR